jgi:hypothetical protein
MTAREFERMPLTNEFDFIFLGKFFSTCDELRFSGADIKPEDITFMLDDLRAYLDKLSFTLRSPAPLPESSGEILQAGKAA